MSSQSSALDRRTLLKKTGLVAAAGSGFSLGGSSARARRGHNVSWEQAWTLENVTIAGFDRGIAGRAHLFTCFTATSIP